MKFLAIAIIFAVAILNSEAYHDLTSRDCRQWRSWMSMETNQMIQIPHESDCTRFYECQHGGLFKKKCDVRQVYNPFDKMCEWDYKFECIRFEDYSRIMEQRVGRQPWMISAQ